MRIAHEVLQTGGSAGVADRDRPRGAEPHHGLRLPPGQRPVEGFPRFGTHLHHPPPVIPEAYAIEVSGAVAEAFALPLAELARELAPSMTIPGRGGLAALLPGVAGQAIQRL